MYVYKIKFCDKLLYKEFSEYITIIYFFQYILLYKSFDIYLLLYNII